MQCESSFSTHTIRTTYNNPNGRENWLPFFILRLSSSTYFNIRCWISTLDFFFSSCNAFKMYWLIAPSSFSSHCTYVIEQQTLYTTKKREMIIIFLWENVWHNFFYALIFCWEKKNMFAAKVPIIFTQLWSLARWVSTISQNNFFFIFPKKIF